MRSPHPPPSSPRPPPLILAAILRRVKRRSATTATSAESAPSSPVMAPHNVGHRTEKGEYSFFWQIYSRTPIVASSPRKSRTSAGTATSVGRRAWPRWPARQTARAVGEPASAPSTPHSGRGASGGGGFFRWLRPPSGTASAGVDSRRNSDEGGQNQSQHEGGKRPSAASSVGSWADISMATYSAEDRRWSGQSLHFEFSNFHETSSTSRKSD